MSTASHSSTLNILYGLAQHLAQQLKSFICNVPLPHRSSFRCKRSNNFLNKRQKKNIYKIPIQLIINGLSKAPLCIWTTVGPVGKGHTAINHLKNKTEKKCFRNYQYYIFTEYTWNKFPLKVEKAFGSFLLFFLTLYISSQIFCRFQVLNGIWVIKCPLQQLIFKVIEVKIKSASLVHYRGWRRWLRGSTRTNPK